MDLLTLAMIKNKQGDSNSSDGDEGGKSDGIVYCTFDYKNNNSMPSMTAAEIREAIEANKLVIIKLRYLVGVYEGNEDSVSPIYLYPVELLIQEDGPAMYVFERAVYKYNQYASKWSIELYTVLVSSLFNTILCTKQTPTFS